MKIADNRLNTIKEFFNKELVNLYSADEVQIFFTWCAQKILGLSNVQLQAGQQHLLSESELLKFFDTVKRLKKQEPIQYILGETEFYRLPFKVSPAVLIPRPETEELVHLILEENRSTKNEALHLLDIGTGSGCIPISIKKNNPQWTVSALDISHEALELAKQNAVVNKVEVDFFKADILSKNAIHQFTNSLIHQFQIIVSNPPYVLKSEQTTMNANVVEYEPHLALFVNDTDPLLFYHAIAVFAKQNLASNGKLYFEINEKLGAETAELLKEKRFTNVEVIKDISGKDRVVRGSV